jgi:large subunit ribosomal protein L13
MKTTTLKQSDLKPQWHLIDLSGQTLGRVATQIAGLLMGKDKVLSANHLDNGDFVVAINSDQIKVTGNKLSDKIYYRHSGFPGGLRSITLGDQMAKDSRKVIESAIKGMLPKNKLRDIRIKKLKVFVDDKHPYQNQLAK